MFGCFPENPCLDRKTINQQDAEMLVAYQIHSENPQMSESDAWRIAKDFIGHSSGLRLFVDTTKSKAAYVGPTCKYRGGPCF